MKRTLAPIAFTAALFIGSSPGAHASPDSTPAPPTAALKREILELAQTAAAKQKYANEADPAVRARLNELVSRLVAASPSMTIREKLAKSVGSWKDVWSDLPFTRALRSDVYQVVFPSGFYYNVSKYEDGRGGFYTSFLRGRYEVRAQDFAIVFTKAVKQDGFPSDGADLYRMAMRAELGLYDANVDPENTPGLGLEGVLTTAYVDEELRIVGGSLRENGVFDLLSIGIPAPTVMR